MSDIKNVLIYMVVILITLNSNIILITKTCRQALKLSGSDRGQCRGISGIDQLSTRESFWTVSEILKFHSCLDIRGPSLTNTPQSKFIFLYRVTYHKSIYFRFNNYSINDRFPGNININSYDVVMSFVEFSYIFFRL